MQTNYFLLQSYSKSEKVSLTKSSEVLSNNTCELFLIIGNVTGTDCDWLEYPPGSRSCAYPD